MNAKEAAIKIKEVLKGLDILGCYDYDKTYYLFSMTPKGIITNEDNFYLLNKNTGAIKEYPILKDAEYFNKIIMDKSKILKFK